MNKKYYSINDFEADIKTLLTYVSASKYSSIYGVPQGGTVLAMELSRQLSLPLVEEPEPYSLIVDDIIDSGRTRDKFNSNDFICLHKKRYAKYRVQKEEDKAYIGDTFVVHNKVIDWITYWWEGKEKTVADIVVRQLEYIGENPNREGLLGTPERVIKSWEYLFSGYNQNPEDIVTTFESDGYDQIVLLKDIEIYSMCEHHLLPFFGKAHIAYIPDKKVIGISKLARLVDIYARRLQIQERICEQVTFDLMTYLKPRGAACIIEAQHLCMLMRGVEKQNSIMVTSSLKGAFLDEENTRQELMGLIK